MYFIHLYQSEAAHAAAHSYNNSNYQKPWLGLTHGKRDISYNLPPNWTKGYLCFEAIDDCTFSFTGLYANSAKTLSYSADSGRTWHSLAHQEQTPLVKAGEKIMFKGSLSSTYDEFSDGTCTWSSVGRFNAMGNPMSVIRPNDFSSATTCTYGSLKYFFMNCTGLTSARDLQLIATTVEYDAYCGMFNGCTNLVAAPEISATTVYGFSFDRMFSGCTSLVTPPSKLLPTSLNMGSYRNMFAGCTSLTYSPVIYAKTGAVSCMSYMFSHCSNLSEISCKFTQATQTKTDQWVLQVSPTGRFLKVVSSSWPSGINGIPSGWTVVDAFKS